jgi:site-specific DNA-methyltransferase (adenine-specific)
MITITNEDNMQLMARYPDKYFDLAIVDPPYGINAPNMQMGSFLFGAEPGQYKGTSTTVKLKNKLQRLNGGGGKLKNRLLNTSKIDWDYEKPSAEYFSELRRVSKNQIIWGGNYFDLPPTRGIICWDKCQPWENFSQIEMAWTSFDCPAKLFRYSNTGGANKIKKIHPTEKPTALYEFCLSKFAKSGDKILDTHIGSGNIGKACFNLSFDLTGCELSKEIFEDALHSIKMHTEQEYKAAEIEKQTGQKDLFIAL